MKAILLIAAFQAELLFGIDLQGKALSTKCFTFQGNVIWFEVFYIFYVNLMFFEVLTLFIDVKTLLLPEVTFHNFLTRKGSIVIKFKENFMY